MVRRYTAAFALWQGTRLVRGSQNDKIPMLTIPGLVAAAYAFWKGHAQLLAVALFIAHVRCCPQHTSDYHLSLCALACDVCSALTSLRRP